LKITVLGVGNLIRSDEGAGIHALRLLSGRPLPPEVELVEGGTEGLGLLPVFRESDGVIVMDAVLAGDDPGSLYRFPPEAVWSGRLPERLSPHQVGIFDVLSAARLLGGLPRTVIIGVQPGRLDWGLELSAPVARALPGLVDMVVGEIQALLAAHGPSKGGEIDR
jgi:hydrogenase maturation protease